MKGTTSGLTSFYLEDKMKTHAYSSLYLFDKNQFFYFRKTRKSRMTQLLRDLVLKSRHFLKLVALVHNPKVSFRITPTATKKQFTSIL